MNPNKRQLIFHKIGSNKGFFEIRNFDKLTHYGGWHALRYFLFSLSVSNFQPFRVEGLEPTSIESEGSSDSNKTEFNPLGLTEAEISAPKVQK